MLDMSVGVQDRDQQGQRTPRWRGVTLLHELRSKGIPVAMASDNTRDQFFAYGDLDMLEVFNQVMLCHAVLCCAMLCCVLMCLQRPITDCHIGIGKCTNSSLHSHHAAHIGTSLCASVSQNLAVRQQLHCSPQTPLQTLPQKHGPPPELCSQYSCSDSGRWLPHSHDQLTLSVQHSQYGYSQSQYKY